ncbi:hypothetical protein SAMN05421847_0579 [Halpernia humi]|uniref:Uncharacterized protein n=1 Tax=Halpernia humi TaxID=493375 RepID=A0A1H5TUP4_9FLAO|nr:hypothetical protein [Halpernia humi]SEF66489.1 hypothetical protein SAMN05421847_0579 [Halpernia humi]
MDIDKLIDYNLSLVYKAEGHKFQTNYFENPIGKKITHIVRANEFAKYLINEDLITVDGSFSYITRKGKTISENGGWLKYLEVENGKEKHEINKSSIEYENLNLQKEISILTIENLKLQNTQLRRYIIYSVSGFVMGIVAGNIKEIVKFIATYFAHK